MLADRFGEEYRDDMQRMRRSIPPAPGRSLLGSVLMLVALGLSAGACCAPPEGPPRFVTSRGRYVIEVQDASSSDAGGPAPVVERYLETVDGWSRLELLAAVREQRQGRFSIGTIAYREDDWDHLVMVCTQAEGARRLVVRGGCSGATWEAELETLLRGVPALWVGLGRGQSELATR